MAARRRREGGGVSVAEFPESGTDRRLRGAVRHEGYARAAEALAWPPGVDGPPRFEGSSL